MANWFVPVFFLFIVTVGPGIVSKLSGWDALARTYGMPQPFSGKRFRLCSVRMRFGASYNNCVTFGSDSAGLHIWIWPIFRVGHPPLFIPWEDISFGEKRGRIRKLVRLQFMRCPSVPFMIFESLAEKLKDASGRRPDFERAE
jgi:hypothetical protein